MKYIILSQTEVDASDADEAVRSARSLPRDAWSVVQVDQVTPSEKERDGRD